MYNVYIQYYKNANGTINTSTTPTLMFAIPSNSTAGFPVEQPMVKSSEDMADSFDFSMDMDSPYYSSLIQLKTLIRVDYDGTTIFFGRVLTISGSTVFQTKKVHCEGAYAFLNDSYYEGKADRYRDKITVSTFINRFIPNHNSSVESWKAVTRGAITLDGSNSWNPSYVNGKYETKKLEPTSWTQTSGLLSSLKNEFGGHFRVRYTNGTLYLDWYKYYARDLGNGLRPVVSVGKNILDISSDYDVGDIFTRLIPTGADDGKGKQYTVQGYKYNGSNAYPNKYISVSFLHNIFSDTDLTDEYRSPSDYNNAENNYGIIYKQMQFSDADTQVKLWEKATAWMKECYYGTVTSFTIKAIDMHFQNNDDPKILLGDCVDVKYLIKENGSVIEKNQRLICKSVQYDLFNPENNSYTFGIPSDILKKTYSDKNKSGGKTASGGGGVNPPKEPKEYGYDLTFDNIADLIGNLEEASDYGGTADAYLSFRGNGEISKVVKIRDPKNPDSYINATVVGKITLPGKSTKYVAMAPSLGLFAFEGDLSDSVKDITFTYIENDPDSNKTYTYTSDYGITMDFAGETITITPDTSVQFFRNVGTAVAPVLKKAIGIDIGSNDTFASAGIKIFSAVGDGINSALVSLGDAIKGSVIGGFLGLRNSDNTPIIEADASDGTITVSDENSNETVSIDGSDGTVNVGKNDGEWLVKLNDTVTYVDENGDTRTLNGFVTANDFSLPDIPSFKTKLIVTDELIAGKATIGQLNAVQARIDTLEAINITTRNLSTGIANITSGININGNLISSRGAQFSAPVYATEFHLGSYDGSKNVGYALLGGEVKNNGNDTYSIVGYDFYGNEIPFLGTFSRATTLSAGWGGTDNRTYQVSAIPQNVSRYTTLFSAVPMVDSYWDGTDIKVTLHAQNDGEESGSYPAIGPITVMGSQLYEEAFQAGVLSAGPSTLGASWDGNRKFTVTANPQTNLSRYTQIVDSVTKSGITWNGYMGTATLRATIDGSESSMAIGTVIINGEDLYTAAFEEGRAEGSSAGTTSLTGTWNNAATFRAVAMPQEAEVSTHLTNTGHWGVASNSEDVNTYYYATYATINNSATPIYTGNYTNIDASGRYYAGKASVSLTDFTTTASTSATSGTITIRTSGRTNSSGSTEELSKSLNVYLSPGSWSNNKFTVSLRHTNSNSGPVIAAYPVDATSIYYAGKAAVTLNTPTATAGTDTSGSIIVSTNGRTNASGTTENLSATASVHLILGTWSSNKIVVSAKGMSSSGTTIAQRTVDATSIYYAGKAAVSLATPIPNAGTASSGTISVSTNGRTNTSGTAAELTTNASVFLSAGSWSSNKIVVSAKGMTSNGTTIAQLTVNATSIYYAGKAAVTLNTPTATAGTGTSGSIIVSTNGRTNASGTTENLSATASVYLSAGSWSSNKIVVSAKGMSSSGTTIAQYTVDASSIYTAGYNACAGTVKISGLSVSSSTASQTLDFGTKYAVYAQFTNSSGSTSNVGPLVFATPAKPAVAASVDYISSYSPSPGRYSITGGAGTANATCSMGFYIYISGYPDYVREIVISQPVTQAYRDGYAAGRDMATIIPSNVSTGTVKEGQQVAALSNVRASSYIKFTVGSSRYSIKINSVSNSSTQ